MIPTVILYALAMWQQGQTKPITTTGDSDKTLQGGGLITPFDVPPVQSARYGEFVHYEDCSAHGLKRANSEWCEKPIIERACTDKYRFLLMSEDGKWHCLRLEGK